MAVLQEKDIHGKKCDMFSIAFCNSNDKDTMTETVVGSHVEDDCAKDNGGQTDDKVFKRKRGVACICAGAVKGNHKVRKDSSG